MDEIVKRWLVYILNQVAKGEITPYRGMEKIVAYLKEIGLDK